MPAKEWTEADWGNLLLAIDAKQCTPFLGAGAASGVLPNGKDLAQRWALEHHYPFKDSDNLPRVAQYMNVKKLAPKLRLKKECEDLKPPDFNRESEIHRLVADLDLKVYITTNYDDFMFRALRRNPHKTPLQRVCEWHVATKTDRAMEEEILPKPTRMSPLVYHLHGTFEDTNSMVLTEDDYLDFLIALTEEQALIPKQVTSAFSNSALLFLGYSLEDLNFKVIFRRMARYMRGTPDARHVSVQLKPKHGDKPTSEEIELAEKQREYFERRYELDNVNVYWGTCDDFAAALLERIGVAK